MSTPLKAVLAEKIQENLPAIEAWFRARDAEAPPPFYSSVDLRDAGFKIAPVDCNLYPAGFNNICQADRAAAGALFRTQIDSVADRAGLRGAVRRVLLIPELNTQNAYYAENLGYLLEIFTAAGCDTRLGWVAAPGQGPPDSDAVIEFRAPSGATFHAAPARVDAAGALTVDGFVPDLVVLNNDFSAGYPSPLDAVRAQPVVPSHRLGWHTRKKSSHFQHYNALAAEFAALAGIDPWSIQVETRVAGPVNFNEGVGIEDTAREVESLLARMRAEYERNTLAQEPVVFVKSNAGTYGMGIMALRSADELRQMNRREKNKMSVGKNRLAIDSVVVQEGIPTHMRVDEHPAEPVIYLSGCQLIGGFLRSNTERGDNDNLNSRGMVFKKLCTSELQELLKASMPDSVAQNHRLLELVYGSIARLSALAAGREIAADGRPSIG